MKNKALNGKMPPSPSLAVANSITKEIQPMKF